MTGPVDDPASRQPSRACRDGLPYLDRALLDRFPLDLLAAGALDRAGDAAAHPEPIVCRVRDRIYLERRDVALEPSSSVKQRVEPDGQAGRKLTEPLERKQHARDVRLARERVVADRQQLSVAAEEHLLVRDEAGQAHRMDHGAADQLRSRLGRPGRGVLLLLAVQLDDLRPRQERRASSANRIIRTAPSAKFGA